MYLFFMHPCHSTGLKAFYQNRQLLWENCWVITKPHPCSKCIRKMMRRKLKNWLPTLRRGLSHTHTHSYTWTNARAHTQISWMLILCTALQAPGGNESYISWHRTWVDLGILLHHGIKTTGMNNYDFEDIFYHGNWPSSFLCWMRK